MAARIKFVDTTEKEPVIKGTPKVPKEFSKKLLSMDGSQVIYFIDKDWGYANRLWPVMKVFNLHPIYPNFCEITIPIKRVDEIKK